jgi:Holliday junction resolvase-like predicted endonuclease
MLQHNQQPCGVIAERANDVITERANDIIANVEVRHQRQTVTQNGTCAALQL